MTPASSSPTSSTGGTPQSLGVSSIRPCRRILEVAHASSTSDQGRVVKVHRGTAERSPAIAGSVLAGGRPHTRPSASCGGPHLPPAPRGSDDGGLWTGGVRRYLRPYSPRAPMREGVTRSSTRRGCSAALAAASVCIATHGGDAPPSPRAPGRSTVRSGSSSIHPPSADRTRPCALRASPTASRSPARHWRWMLASMRAVRVPPFRARTRRACADACRPTRGACGRAVRATGFRRVLAGPPRVLYADLLPATRAPMKVSSVNTTPSAPRRSRSDPRWCASTATGRKRAGSRVVRS
jgi:hypothetical protein